MPYTRRQIVTTVSIVYLILLTAVAGYAASRASNLSLPIPKSLTGFTSSLPIIAGLLLEGSYNLTHSRSGRNRPLSSPPPTTLYAIIANALILVYSTAVITLLGTHTGPASSLLCNLNDRWLSLYRAKDGDAIKTIQDTFKCCGLHSVVDKAYPFPDKKNGVDACKKSFGRTISCFESWRGQEQGMSGVLMGVVGLVVIWQLVIAVAPSTRSPWLREIVAQPVEPVDDEEQGRGNSPRRAIAYEDTDNRITEEDQSENENENGNEGRKAIEGRTKNALPGERSNGGQAQPTHVTNEWTNN